MNRRCPVLVETGRHRLEVVASETMRCGRGVSKRYSGGRSNDANGIKDNEQTRCLLPLSIGQKSSHLLCYADTQASDQTAIIWPGLTSAATHDDRAPEIMISANWLSVLRIYLSSSAIGHLVWEILQLPFYTIWTAQFRDRVFAVIATQ